MRLVINVIVLLLTSHLGLSQNLKFETYTVENGLSNNSINTIEIDRSGGLWMGTWDGLNYFDGHEFITFKHNANDSTSLPNNFIYKIIRDINQNLWILSSGNQISLYNKDKSFSNYSFKQDIDRIGLSKNKTILVQTGHNLYTYYKEKFIPCKSCIFYDDIEDWKETFRLYLPNVEFVSYLKDSKGNIWIGSRNRGLFYIPSHKILDLEKASIQNYTNDPYNKFSLQSNEIMEIKEDSFHNIWIGTKDGGISRVYKNSDAVFYATNHPIENPYLPNEAIRAITVDSHNQIWLGYYSQGLFRRKKGESTFTPFTIPEAKYNAEWNKIRALYTASDGSIFGGTYAGIFRYKNGKFMHFKAQENNLFPNNRNYAFFETEDNLLYVACWGGVALLDLNSNEFISFKGQSLLNNYHVRDIISVNNQLFIATEKAGIIGLKNGVLTTVKDSVDAPENSVYSLWLDNANDNLWCGTLDGILIYNLKQKKVIKRITEANGLNSHLVYGILGYENQVWLSTTDGLIVMDKNTLDIYKYPGQEGLQAAEFSEGAYHLDHKHIMYFGGVKGLNYFNPDNIDLREDIPIIKLYIDHKERKGEYTKTYESNKIVYTIDPTFYSISNGNVIYYMLEGYDNNWRVTNYDKRDIVYDNLPAGDYIFKVFNSRNPKESIAHHLHIQKPFWSTIYFYLILFLILIIFITLLLIGKRRKQLKREKILEEKIKERVEEISMQKNEISIKNKELLQKNIEISKQKETMQRLHAQLKTEAMEMEKFNGFLVKEYKKPLSKINHQLKNISSDKKQTIQKEINGLLNKILAINYLSKIDENYQPQPSVIALEKVTENIFEEISTKLDGASIKYNIKKNIQVLWVLLDVFCFKIFIKSMFAEIIKYPDATAVLDISYDITPEKVFIQVKSNSRLLSKNLYYIKHYSPYYKTCQTIANLLSIDFKVLKEEQYSLFNINFVPEVVKEDNSEHTKLNWMHVQLENKIDKSKPTILVWAKEVDQPILHQLLPEDSYNLIIEENKDMLLSVVKSINIDMLLIYNIGLNEIVYKITTQLNKKHAKIKILYMTEEVNHELEQHVIEMGMDDIIMLPVNKTYIENKIQKLINNPKNALQSNLIYESLNHILNEKVNNQNEKLIQDALSIIQQRMSDSNFNVKELCDALEISSIKCYRVFKEVLDIAPSEFILNIKMNKAESLLLNSNLNIAEIAYETGFADPKYFSKVFKKTFGKSPKKYKNQKR